MKNERMAEYKEIEIFPIWIMEETTT